MCTMSGGMYKLRIVCSFKFQKDHSSLRDEKIYTIHIIPQGETKSHKSNKSHLLGCKNWDICDTGLDPEEKCGDRGEGSPKKKNGGQIF